MSNETQQPSADYGAPLDEDFAPNCCRAGVNSAPAPCPWHEAERRADMAQAWDEGYLRADVDYEAWRNGARGERFERVLDANPYRVIPPATTEADR